MGCAYCNKTHGEFLQTAYGYYLCENCWDEYINTDAGRIEYLIGICNGELPIEEFDADFLCEVAKSWRTHSRQLIRGSQYALEIENKAKELGIL